MWRFIIMTFAFLGWSFYTLSGGADYQPREGSRQAEALKARAAAEMQAAQAPAAPEQVVADSTDDAPRDLLDLTKIEEVRAVLDLSGQPLLQDTADAQIIAAGYDDARIANLTLAKPAAFAQAAGMTPASVETASVQPETIRDLRRVTGNSVNMRSGPGTKFGVLARVARNTEVEVLETYGGEWLRLRIVETNRVGWIASRLVSSAADRG